VLCGGYHLMQTFRAIALGKGAEIPDESYRVCVKNVFVGFYNHHRAHREHREECIVTLIRHLERKH
jgi:hypothetical protein